MRTGLNAVTTASARVGGRSCLAMLIGQYTEQPVCYVVRRVDVGWAGSRQASHSPPLRPGSLIVILDGAHSLTGNQAGIRGIAQVAQNVSFAPDLRSRFRTEFRCCADRIRHNSRDDRSAGHKLSRFVTVKKRFAKWPWVSVSKSPRRQKIVFGLQPRSPSAEGDSAPA